MDEQKLATMLGNALGTGAAVAVLLLILWRVLRGIAERWIASLDANTAVLREHTARDLDSHRELGDRVSAGHTELTTTVVRMDAKLDSALNWMDRDRSGPQRRRRDTE